MKKFINIIYLLATSISPQTLWREIFAERTRVILTILALAWGTMSIAVMLAVGEGLRVTFMRGMSGLGDNVVFVKSGKTSDSFHGQAINQNTRFTESDLTLISDNITGIAKITPEYRVNAKIQHGDKSFSAGNASISAVEPYYHRIRQLKIEEGGRFISDFDMHYQRRVIVLGDQLAEKLFPQKTNIVGQQVFVDKFPFTVIGVLQKKVEIIQMGRSDRLSAWIPASTYISLANPQTIDTLVFIPKNVDQIASIEEDIRHLFARQHGLDPNDEDILEFHDSQKRQTKTSGFFNGMELFLGFIGTLTLLIAGIGIANVMLVSVSNATKEIGIRMAIGAQRFHILGQYLIEALLVTILGGVIGFLFAIVIVHALAAIPIPPSLMDFLGKLQPVISWHVVVIVIVVLGCIGLLAGFFPAWQAAKIDPAEALRHERT